MKLKSFGCSFISGTDLPDIAEPHNHSLLTWPALLAAEFDLQYQCYAGGGHGNLSIIDRLSREIHCDPTSLFVVQWTYIDRFDYSDPRGHHYGKDANDWLTIRPGTDSPLTKLYFDKLHSEYRDKLNGLLYVKTALDLLESNQCRFLMTCMDQLLLCEKYHCSMAMQAWQKQIAANLRFFEGTDFLAWSRYRGFPIGATGHPLEQAHAAAAKLMLPIIDAILHRA